MSVIRDLLDSTKLLLNDSLATTGSNIFVGTQTLSGSIIPAADNIYDLGSPTKQWRDLYLSSASLYIDGTKVISSNTDTLTFTTDTGQSIKLLETGGDDITLQTDTGNIELKGTVEIESGKKITDSAGTMINFGNSIAVTGSIETTGTVDGIDLQAFSSSVATGLAAGGGASSWNELSDIPFGIISGSSQITITESQISDLTHYTDSDVKTKLNTEGVISGSTQVDYTSIQNTPTTITTQQASDITTNNSKVGYTDALVKTKLDTENVVSGSSQITTLLNGEDLTLANLTVNGTQTILDSTRLAIGDNIIELNGGGATNGGLLIKDVTAPNNVSGSLLWDSTNDYWIGGPLGSESKLLRATGDNIISGSSQVDYNSIQNKPTNVSSFTNDVGYLTSYTDTNTTYTAGTNLTLTGTEFSLNSSPTLTGLTSTGNVSITSNSNTLTLYNNSNNDAFRVFRGSLQTLGLWTATNGTILSLSSDTVAGSIALDSRANQPSYINTGGRVGIGTSNPLALLDLRKDDDTVYDPTDDNGQRGSGATIQLNNNSTTTNSFGQIMYDSDSTGQAIARIVFLDDGASSSEIAFVTEHSETKSEKLRITSHGDVVINGGALRNQTNLNSTGDAGLLIPSGDRFGFDESGTRSWNIKATGGNLDFNSGDGNGTYSFNSNISVNGTITATALTETSALRFKENIQEDIDSSIIDKLRPVSYDWKESKEKDYGFIAEEVNELDSTLTTENEDGEMLGIKYTKLIPFLVKKIQEQEERIKQLENGNS